MNIYQPPELFTDEDERLAIMSLMVGIINGLILTAAIVGVCAAIWCWGPV